MSHNSDPIGDIRGRAMSDLVEGAFPGMWDLVRQAQDAHVAELTKRLADVKGLSTIDYFEEHGFVLGVEHCRTVLKKDLPEGAHAQWASAFGKPWAIRLTYRDAIGSIETHVNLDWSTR